MRNYTFCHLFGLMLIAPSLHSILKQVDLAHATNAVFNETRIVSVNTKKKYPATISYLFADIKYQDGIIKICEFGGGNNASSAASKVIYNGKSISIDTPYWPIFWQYLHQFDKPIWNIGQAWANARAHATVLNDAASFPTNTSLKTTARTNRITSHQGIIIFNGKVLSPDELNEFYKTHPDILFVNRESRQYSSNKLLLAQLLDTPDLHHLKPRWGQYEKKYTPNLAEKILNDLQANVVVIKPINSMQAKGIIMVQAAHLDATLKNLFDPALPTSKRVFDRRDEAAYNHWQRDHNKVFMVEACENSKPINIRGDWYNPTMRVVFVLCHDAGKIYTTILGGYWKIPAKPITDTSASLTEKSKTVPMHHIVQGYTGLEIAENDFSQVKSIMYKVLPKIYERMLLATTPLSHI